MSSVVSTIALLLAMSVASLQNPSRAASRENVETAIDVAIHLLESNDYKAFLLQFVPPDDVKARGGSPEALNEWVRYFSAQASSVLAALKYARTEKPTYDEAKTTATFPLKGEPPELRMVKIGKYWYIGNK